MTKSLETQGKKVFVGMSGGVDSSVSAHLLKSAGFDVTGVFIKVWQPNFVNCTWREDRLDAMKVAAHLDIPFKTLDLEDVYKKEVIDYMISEYKLGRTPNPDVFCNKEVKFGAFLNFAIQNGADYVATGHYAENNFNQKTNQFELKRSKDSTKDQAYFLWTLTQKQLCKILFPVGSLEKTEVRKIAKKAGLETATKRDSQGLCFISNVDMKDFLLNFIDKNEGDVLSEDGKKIGTHSGAFLYTIGERHGFSVLENKDKVPFYVVAKDVSKNTITVSKDKKPSTHSSAKKEIIVKDLNWINEIPDKEKTVDAETRYHGDKIKCKVDQNKVYFEDSILLAPGQSIVFYDGERCLGGGIIS